MELVDLIWLMVRIHEVHMFDWVDYFGMDGSDLADGMDLWMNLCRMTHVGFMTTCILYVPRHVHVHIRILAISAAWGRLSKKRCASSVSHLLL